MVDGLNRESVTGGRCGYLSSFINGYLMPYNVQARLMAQEPLIEYVPSESGYVRSAWNDTITALNAAMVQYAEEA